MASCHFDLRSACRCHRFRYQPSQPDPAPVWRNSNSPPWSAPQFQHEWLNLANWPSGRATMVLLQVSHNPYRGEVRKFVRHDFCKSRRRSSNNPRPVIHGAESLTAFGRLINMTLRRNNSIGRVIDLRQPALRIPFLADDDDPLTIRVKSLQCFHGRLVADRVDGPQNRLLIPSPGLLESKLAVELRCPHDRLKLFPVELTQTF